MPSLARLVDADLRCYLENIATDFYSPYHKWYDGRPVDWRFARSQTALLGEPRWIAPRLSASRAFPTREWLNKIHDRLIRSVRDAASL